VKLKETWKSIDKNQRGWILIIGGIILLGILPRLNLPTPIPFPKEYPLNGGTFAQGAKAYKEGKYGLALANFISAGSHSDIRSMSMAARMYTYGQGVKRDICQGTYWADMAARNGDPINQMRLSIAYYFSYGIKSDDEKAYLWAKAAEENKNIDNSIKWYKELTGVELDTPSKWMHYILPGYDKKEIATYNAEYAKWEYRKAPPAKIIRIRRIPYIGISSVVECSKDIVH
jgi:TPR repeat protein